MTDPKHILEEYLVTSARLGDQKARGDLVALRGPRLLVHATRLLGDVEEARDVVQDAWIEIFRGLRGLRDVGAFPAWATRIVTRRCARFIRSKQKQRALADALIPEGPVATQAAGPEAAEATMIRRAIATLPRDQAATIALFYLDDMNVAEVSVALDVPVGTVKTRLMHARGKLKAILEGENDD